MTIGTARLRLLGSLFGAPGRPRPARGRIRLVLTAAAPAALAALIGAAAWWGQLHGLPDAAEPIGVAELLDEVVAPQDNAYVSYRHGAAETYPFRPDMIWGVDGGWADAWADADAQQRGWPETLRRPLAFWRRGTDCVDALPRSSGSADPAGGFAVEHMRMFARLATLQGTRVAGEGDPRAGWSWYRAVLRSSRHVAMRNDLRGRGDARRIVETAALPIARWAADPMVDVELVQRALDDVRDCRRMTPSPSRSLRMEYNRLMAWLDDPGTQRVAVEDDGGAALFGAWLRDRPWLRVRLRRDQERSRRVARLIFADWIAQVEKPAARRPKLNGPRPTLYADADFAGLSEARLRAWFDSTDLLRHWLENDLASDLSLAEADDRSLRAVETSLATRLFHEEHGREPADAAELAASGYLASE